MYFNVLLLCMDEDINKALASIVLRMRTCGYLAFSEIPFIFVLIFCYKILSDYLKVGFDYL